MAKIGKDSFARWVSDSDGDEEVAVFNPIKSSKLRVFRSTYNGRN